MIRAKNEAATIHQCIRSIVDGMREQSVPFDIVLIDNGSTDDTVELAFSALANTDVGYTIARYPLQIAKAGLETYVTDCNSAHSFPWYTTWCTMQCTRFSHIFRWDADFCMTKPLADCLAAEFADGSVPADAYAVSAEHEDGDFGSEVYLLAARRGIHYIRSFLWEHWAFYDGELATYHYAANTGDKPVTLHSKTPEQVALRVLPQRCHVVHVSKLATVKTYLQWQPWWHGVPPDIAALPHAVESAQSYARWLEKLNDGTQTFCRSRDPGTTQIIDSLPRNSACIRNLKPFLFETLVFQVGAHKTATVAIHNALNALGLEAMHVEPEYVEDVVDRHLLAGKPYENVVAFADFVWMHSDVEWSKAQQRVAKLAQLYPRAKFILNTRNVDNWLQSYYRHGVEFRLYDESERDLRVLKQRWYEWNAFVLSLFVDAPHRLLCFDVERDDPVRLAQFVRPDRGDMAVDFWHTANKTGARGLRIFMPPSQWWHPHSGSDVFAAHKQRLTDNFGAIFGAAFVINLPQRTDRLRQFCASMQNAGIDESLIERVEAIANAQQPWLGCCQSHIKVLEQALVNNYARITVFEDDFAWCSDRLPLWPHIENLHKTTTHEETLSFDVCLLSARVIESEAHPTAQGMSRVRRAFTAAGYVVERPYYAKLLETLRASEQALANVHSFQQLVEEGCALDVRWQSLQRVDRWICHSPTLGKQYDSHSDIENRFCSHDYR